MSMFHSILLKEECGIIECDHRTLMSAYQGYGVEVICG